MNTLDGLLLLFLAACARRGWRRGLLREGFELAGVLLGLTAAYAGRAWYGERLAEASGLPQAVASAAAFAFSGIGVVWLFLWLAERSARGAGPVGSNPEADGLVQSARRSAWAGGLLSVAKGLVVYVVFVSVLAMPGWAAADALLNDSWTASWILDWAPSVFAGAYRLLAQGAR